MVLPRPARQHLFWTLLTVRFFIEQVAPARSFFDDEPFTQGSYANDSRLNPIMSAEFQRRKDAFRHAILAARRRFFDDDSFTRAPTRMISPLSHRLSRLPQW